MAPYDNSGEESAETLQDHIPIIDLAGIDGPERQNICKQIAEACETWGFFHLVNHGIHQSLIRRVKEVSTEFFHGSEEEKFKVIVQPFQLDGWHHPAHMIEGTAMTQKDAVEHLHFSNFPKQQVPQHPAAYKATFVEYTKELRFLAEKLLGLLSEMLGLAPEAIQTALISGSSSQALRVAVRTNFYGLSQDGEALPGVCHAHSDPGGLTFLLADDAPGLEVRKDSRWVKIDPIGGGFIVNVGDMIEVCSNGRYTSVEHRGFPAHKQERLTVAGFFGCPRDAVIGPITALLDESHPPVYKTMKFEAYVQAYLKAGFDGKSTLERHKL